MNKKLDKRLASLFLRIDRKKLFFLKKREVRDNKRVMSPLVPCPNPRDPTKTLLLTNKS
jgi:hypothetical protein